MFGATSESLADGRITKYRLACAGTVLAHSDVLDLWGSKHEFRGFFTQLLATSCYAGYRWETPPLTRRTAHSPFEFVLLDAPGFCSRPADAKTYDSYFTRDDTDQGIVLFANLSGDATLIVPSPRVHHDAYGHLAVFLRHAPEAQRDAFWRVIGTTVQSQISENPLWLSTAGGGVAWVHARLDSRPKYYGYSPYRRYEDISVRRSAEADRRPGY